MGQHMQQLLQASACPPKGMRKEGQGGFTVPPRSPLDQLSFPMQNAGSPQIRWH